MTVMTANGEVRTRREATVYVKQLDLFVTVMLLVEETPAVLGENLRTMGFHTTGSALKTHISSEMARELNAMYRTMYHLWFVVYQRALPQPHLHLLLDHLHHWITYLMSTKTQKIQYHQELEVRVRSYGETRCMNSQKQRKQKKRGITGSTKRCIA